MHMHGFDSDVISRALLYYAIHKVSLLVFGIRELFGMSDEG